MTNQKPSFFVVGLALFSMFFGSGNLIFPLMLGRDAGSLFMLSASGFVLSAVFIPVLGILAIAFAEGNYELIFARLLGKKAALTLILIVLLSFIPFGAGPRCVVLAHASLDSFVSMPPLWIFSLIFLSVVGLLVKDKRQLINILGKVLTPILLIAVMIMVGSAFLYGTIDPPRASTGEIFKTSLFEGYNTQDLLSSLFFSSSLIALMRASFTNKKDMIVTMLKGSMLGVSLLVLLYVTLIAASSLHSDILIGHSGIHLVSILAKYTLGENFGLIAGIAVALACLTTAVALVMAFYQFLSAHVLPNRVQGLALPISLLSIFFTSLLKFEGIMAIISPLMKIIYPLVVVVVLHYLFQLYRNYRRKQTFE